MKRNSLEVIISFGAMSDDFQGSLKDIPRDIHRIFEATETGDELLEAVDYFNEAVGYFSGALKFDSRYKGLGVNVALWDGFYSRLLKRLR
jgi:hypothetical protein